VFGESEIAGFDNVADFQSPDPDGDGFGDPIIGAIDLNFLQMLSEGAAVFESDGFAAEFECDIDGGATIGIDAEQIKVEDVGGEHIPLDFLHDGFIDRAVEFNVDDGRSVGDQFFDDFAADGDGFAGLAQTVEVSGNATGTTNELSTPGTG
jgi:hypothetical protein